MKKYIIYGVVFVFTLFIGNESLQAQKFGYLDSSTILAEMPEVKQAESQLSTLQKQLQKKGQQKLESLQNKYQDLARQEQAGEIAPKALQEQAELLKAEELELSQYEQEMQQQIMNKREELLQPILDRVQTIIDDVAAEEGYVYVFDSSTGILLYADDALDITSKVKAKLGL